MASPATMVEYMTVLSKLGMISNKETLTNDEDPQLVKRTIRDLACAHRLSLSLVSSGMLEPQQFEKDYKEVCAMSYKLTGLLTTTHNEEIALNLVMCLELVLESAKNVDILRFSCIAEMTKKAVDVLLEYVKTPHVGDSALCIAMRALIAVACYQVDLRPGITELVEDLISSPPPNLFDHSNRSLHKTLERSLSQLQTCVEDDGDKEKLVNLTGRVEESYERLVSATEREEQRSPLQVAEVGGQSTLSLPSNKRTKLPEKNAVKRKFISSLKLTPGEIRLFGPKSLPKEGLRSRRVKRILKDAEEEKQLKMRPMAWSSISSILEKIRTKENKSSPASPHTESVEPCKKRFPSERSSQSPPMSGKKLANDDDAISKNVASEEFHNLIPGNIISTTVAEIGMKQREQIDLERVILDQFDLNFEKEGNSCDGYSEQFLARCSSVEGRIFTKLNRQKVVDFFLSNSTVSPEQIPHSPEWAYVYKLKTKREKLLRALTAHFPGSNFWPEKSESASVNSPCIDFQSFNINRTESPSQLRRDDADPESSSNLVGNSPVQACCAASELSFPTKDINLRQELMSPPESCTLSHRANNGSSLLKFASVGVPNSSVLLGSPEATSCQNKSLTSTAQDAQLNNHPMFEKSSSTNTSSPYLTASEETPCRARPSSQEVGNTTVSTEPSTTSRSSFWMPSALPTSSTQSDVSTASTGNSVPANSMSELDLPLKAISNVYRDSHHNWSNVHDDLQNEIHRHDRTKWVNSHSRDTRGKENFDPQGIPHCDFTHGNYAGSRQTVNVDSYQIPEIAHRRRPELDNPYKMNPSQFYKAEPRPMFNGHHRPMINARWRRHPQYGSRPLHHMIPQQSPNVDPYITRNARPNPNPVYYSCRPDYQLELGINVRLLGDRGVTTPFYRTAKGAPRALCPGRAYGPDAGRGPAFGRSFARDRYKGGEKRGFF